MTAYGGTPIVLPKGGNISLRDLDAELGSVTVVLETAGPDDITFDADVSVMLLGSDDRVRSNDDLVFYNQPVAVDGAIHLRDKVRAEVDGASVVLDTVSVNLDRVPDDVAKIVIVASLDGADGAAFGLADRVRMRLQRASDGEDLLSFDVADATGETALLFGEFYRREGAWRVRAVGQGYAGGLAQLAADYGIEIDQASDDEDGAPAAAETPSGEVSGPSMGAASDSLAEEGDDRSAALSSSRLSVRRSVRAPKMPAAWGRTIPASGGSDWRRAELFPIAGIRGAEEQEARATSSLLAVATMVKEFGRALVAAIGGPAGLIDSFIEVPFGQDEKQVRPDGVIQVSWGRRTWTALVEAKTAAPLLSGQIDDYVEVARSKGYDAVVTISNDLTLSIDDHPVAVDRRKLKKVSLRHLGWDEIRAIATVCLEHRGVADSTQRRLLSEFLRYLNNPKAGTVGFTDLGQHWPRVRDSAKAKTLRSGDRGADEVLGRFDQMIKHIGLGLAALLGVEVQTMLPDGHPGSTTRCQQFADSGVLFGSLRVPGAANVMSIQMDLRTERVSCASTIPAPREGRPATRVNWLLRQLAEAPESLRVEASLVGSRGMSTAAQLKTLRADPQVLLPKDGRDIKAFQLTLDTPLTTRRETGRGSLVYSVEDVTYRFYAEVLQHLQRWTTTKPPQVPPLPA
jgi:stress response protein SCP2